jgi:hypothetical protein
MHSHVILHIRGEPGRKLVAFLVAEPLDVDGAWPIPSKVRPKLGS